MSDKMIFNCIKWNKNNKRRRKKILYSAQYETNLIDLITLNHVAVFTENHSLNNEKIMNKTMA